MSKKNLLFVLETILLVVLSSSLSSCDSNRAPSQATPRPTASQRLDTGPLGLPLYCPKYVKHDQQGNLYVTDNDFGGPKGSHRARIVKLSPTGHLLAEWHAFNTLQFQSLPIGGNVTGPNGFAVDASGTLYVADGGDNTIKKLSPTGQLLATWGKTGSAPGEFTGPHGVAVDAQGNVYVTDRNRIQKFSSTGTLLAVFGNTGSAAQRLNLPTDIALDAQGDLYVTDLRTHRLVKFSPQGQFLTAWSSAGGIDFSSARGVAVDRADNIYLTDTRNLRIVKFSPTGQVLTIWQRPMDLYLFGVTVDPQGNIYVGMTNIPNINGGPRGGIRKLAPSGAVLATWPATCPVG